MSMRSRLNVRAIAALATATTFAPIASAAYYAIDMMPASVFSNIFLYGSSASHQVGYLEKGPGIYRAVVFNGSPVGMQLHIPVGFSSASMHGTNGTYHVGNGDHASGYIHALRWTASGGASIDLTPVGMSSSSASDISATNLIGGWAATPSGPMQAHLWSGTTPHNVHPAGTEMSVVNSVHLNNAAGYVRIAGNYRAIRWIGTTGTNVMLHPTSGYAQTMAQGISSTDQVGWGLPPGAPTSYRALRWTGTATSCTSLHPAAYFSSAAVDTNGSRQVGHAQTGATVHAVYWNGTASSMVNLSSLLPALGPGYGNAYATTINAAGDIAGHAYNSITGRWHPILWKQDK